MTATGFTPLSGSTTSNYYITLSTTNGSVRAKAVVKTAGYAKNETDETSSTPVLVSVNNDKLYIPTNSITGSVTSLTAPSVAISGTVTGMVTSTTTTGYYITIKGTGTNGSVKGTATAGNRTGIVAAGASNTSDA